MWDKALDVLLDATLDTLRLLPFLLITYLLMEYLEHRTSDKIQRSVKNAGNFGPLLGSLLGAVPQCGFSAAASGFYAGKIITLGTLIAIYLSTSDEMLPILISEQVSFKFIAIILAIKVAYGCFVGYLIDFVFHRQVTKIHASSRPDEPIFSDICEQENCNCEESVWKSSIKHTLQILLFIFAVNLLLGALFEFIPEPEETIANISSNGIAGKLLVPFIASFVGLIPNCASSVILTKLMLGGVLSVGGMMAGLLSSAGIGWIILLKAGHSKKATLKVIGILYLAGAIGGLLFGLVVPKSLLM